MAELHSNIYYRHPNLKKHQLLKEFVNSFSGSNELTLKIAQSLNLDDGEQVAQNFLTALKTKYHGSVYPEDTSSQDGYWVSHLINDSGGDYLVGRMVKLLYELCPEVQVQAWGCGDDHPWEYWFKFEGGKVVRCDDQPFGKDDDEHTYKTVYRWWHENLPDGISEGLLNEERVGRFGRDATDEKYQLWLETLKLKSNKIQTDDLPGQGLESPVSQEDVKEMVSAFGKIYTSVKSAPKSGDKSAADTATTHPMMKEQVMSAFREMNVACRALDVNGVLKHISASITGKLIFLEDGQPYETQASYGLYRIGLGMLLKPQAEYQLSTTVTAYTPNPDGTATLAFTSESQYIDPHSGKRTKTISEDEYVWGLVDGALQVVVMNMRQVEVDILG